MQNLADKLKFKQRALSELGKEFVIPAITQGTESEEFSLETIPGRPFVLKTNHDSGGTKIVRDPKRIDVEAAQKWLKKRLSRNFFFANREWEYKAIEPMWFTEPLLEDESGNARLNDYKVHCFNGVPRLVQVISDREERVKESWFDIDWTPLDFFYFSKYRKAVKKPRCLDEMLKVAEQLSRPFPYVRVDFYVVESKPILGEMTFRPFGGFMRWHPDSADFVLGAFLDIDTLRHQKSN